MKVVLDPVHGYIELDDYLRILVLNSLGDIPYLAWKMRLKVRWLSNPALLLIVVNAASVVRISLAAYSARSNPR